MGVSVRENEKGDVVKYREKRGRSREKHDSSQRAGVCSRRRVHVLGRHCIWYYYRK